MEVKAPDCYVWRFLLRRVWQRSSRGDMRKVWRKVWHRVSQAAVHTSTLPSGWNTQLITYADCETFFEAVIKGSKNKLIEMLYNTYGPSVTAELAKCYNEDGETPLLVAIRQGKLEIVKYLTQKLRVPLSQHGHMVWKGVEYPEVPPLFAAILCGQKDIARFLIAAEMQSGQTFITINSIISSSNDRQKKIDTLELLGAAYLSFHQLHGTREHGLLCWKEALVLRHSTTEGWQAIPKPEVRFLSEVARKADGSTEEFTTLEQLEQLNATDLQLYTQSILVSQRIWNVFGIGANLFSDTHLCQYIDMCNKEEEHSRVVCAAIVVFEYYEQQLDNFDCKVARRVLGRATKSFKELLRRGPLNNEEEVTFEYLMKTFEFAIYCATRLHDQERDCRPGTLYDLGMIILEIVLLVVGIFPQLSANETEQFKRCLCRVIRMDHRFGYFDQNLLHLICRCRYPHPFGRPIDWDNQRDGGDEDDDTDDSASECSSCEDDHPYGSDDDDLHNISTNYEEEVEVPTAMEIPSIELQMSVIRLFLELGADPNSTDLMLFTPLILLAKNSEDFGPAQLVIQHGGHVDQVDLEGTSALMYFKEQLAEVVGIADPGLQALINNVLPLSCLAAQIFRKDSVPLRDGIPASLYSFIHCH